MEAAETLQLEERTAATAYSQLLKKCWSATTYPHIHNHNFFSSLQLQVRNFSGTVNVALQLHIRTSTVVIFSSSLELFIEVLHRNYISALPQSLTEVWTKKVAEFLFHCA
jgi:hypothetical protein